MSASSGLAKAWCLTIAAGTVGYAITKNADEVGWMGLFSVAMFATLDARYLREERKFRALYEDARNGRTGPFDMRATQYADRKAKSFARECGWTAVLRSWALWTFYGPLLVAGVVAIVVNGDVASAPVKP